MSAISSLADFLTLSKEYRMEDMGDSDRQLSDRLSYRDLFCLAFKLAWSVIKTKRFLLGVSLLMLAHFVVLGLLYLKFWGFPQVPAKVSNGPVLEPRPDWNVTDFLKLAGEEERANYIRRLAPANFHDGSVPLNETAHDWTNLSLAFQTLFGINNSVDPCDDFYEFACGHSAYASNVTNGHLLDTLIFLRLRAEGILDNWNVTTSHSKPMSLAVQFYNQCRHNSYNTTQAAYKILNSLGGWPSIDPDWTEEESEFLSNTAKARRLYAHGPFFAVFVYFHPKNLSRNVIHLDAPKLSISADTIGSDADDDAKWVDYTDSYVNSARLLSGLDDPVFEHEANEVYNLEHQLAIAGSVEAGTDLEQVMMTLGEFQIEMDQVNVATSHAQVNWTNYLNEIFHTSGITVKQDQEIVVRNMNYIRKLPEILDTTALYTLVNYMHWSMLRKWFPEFSKNNHAFPVNLTSVRGVAGENDESAESGLKIHCLAEAMDIFALPLCNEFIKWPHHYLLTNRAAVESMATSLRETFMERIRENIWATDFTKMNVLAKVAGMRQLVGYPDWLANGTKLDERFNKLQLGKTRVESLTNFVHWESDRNFNSLNLDPAGMRDLWSRPILLTSENVPTTDTSVMSAAKLSALQSMSPSLRQITPLEVNSYNLRALNSLVIPMGIFHYYFYHRSHPAYVNFGKLGRIIGHEIGHSFDAVGNRVDAEGKVTEWLSPEDRETFEGYSKCFIHQYSQYELFPGKRVNGTLTLDENISDHLGLQLSYRDYKQAIKGEEVEEPKKLVGLEKLSPDQLFFLSYASSQCETASPEILERRLLHDNHSPNRFRVIGTLQNSKEFAQAWQCPAGSPMNPKTKCDWW